MVSRVNQRYNQPSETVNGLKAESHQCLMRVDVLLQRSLPFRKTERMMLPCHPTTAPGCALIRIFIRHLTKSDLTWSHFIVGRSHAKIKSHAWPLQKMPDPLLIPHYRVPKAPRNKLSSNQIGSTWEESSLQKSE